MVLLVMAQPWSTNRNTTECTSSGVPANITPPGTESWSRPVHAHQLMSETSAKVVGIGVPSKYCALPLASLGIVAAVTLNRARRVSPQRMKNPRHRWSAGVRMPMANAITAGETPNEICLREENVSTREKKSIPDEPPAGAEGSYQVGQRVELLSHHTALLAPARDLAIHEVEEEA